MNTTTYFSGRSNSNSFTNNFRRSSLDLLKKQRSSPVQEQVTENFRKSCSSFDKYGGKSRQQLPQIKIEKQVDGNIYFNQKSRANYFKNLIDSYFEKNQDKYKRNIKKSEGRSSLLRRSVINNKKKQISEEKTQKANQINIKNNAISKKINENSQNNGQVKSVNQISPQTKKAVLSLRYKQQHSHLPNQNYQKQLAKFTQSPLSTKQISEIQKQSYSPSPSKLNLFQPSFLPKITQAADDQNDDYVNSSFQQQISLFDDTNYLLKSQSSFKRLEQKKVLVYENGILKIYAVQENDKKYRIKQFKTWIFLDRHNRALQQGVQSFWKPYRFHELSLMIPYIFPIKDLLFKLVSHPTYPEYYYAISKSFYKQMTANHCQQLFILFRQFVKDLSKTGKKIINNKINLSNIFYLNGKFCLGEWQYSAFKQQNKIQGNYFQSRIQPILKCQNQWLVSPEYLAPEILESIQNPKKPFNLWEYQNASDVYSLGVSFLEIVTLVPMWMQLKTSVKGKIMKPRQGCLSTSNRSIMRILQKQKSLISRMSTILQRQVADNEKNWKFFNILLKMIEPDRSKRIKLDQIIFDKQ